MGVSGEDEDALMITFVSAYLNHHQLLLCEELRKYCDEFYYISTVAMPSERLSLGYEDVDSKYDYVIRAYDGSTDESRIEEILLASDAVIFGDCDNKYIEIRMRENKLSFLYSERFFKKGIWRRFIPQTRKKIHNRIVRFKDKNLYVLCASAFLSYDLKLLDFDTDKCFKWGYFPKIKDYTECPERNNSVPRILWAGRMLDWKHPHHAVQIAARLKNKGYNFTLDIIGGGECEEELKRLVSELSVDDKVRFLGSMSPADVIENMESADIFLMTSDYYEGWGAVVNEAMSTGCATLASSAVGSVPFLIDTPKNGIIYRYGDFADFENKLELLIRDAKLRKSIGKASFETIKNEYNHTVAVKRLMEFIDSGCKGAPYKSGPMSKAAVIKNKWY